MPLHDYYLEGKKEPSRYNDITVIKPDDPPKKPVADEDEDEEDYKDPYKVSTANGGSIMPESVLRFHYHSP